MMDFFKCLIIVIFCKYVVARTKTYSLSNKQGTLSLNRTRLTIFIDLHHDEIYWPQDEIADYCRYLKVAFRRNPCLTATLFHPTMSKFIEVNEWNLESTLDSVLHYRLSDVRYMRPLVINMTSVIEDFVVETKPNCLGTNHTVKQTVLYISNFFTSGHEPLRELSDIGGSCSVLMVAFFWNGIFGSYKDKDLNFLDWLPFHRLITYLTDLQPFKIKELLPSHIELFKLIENPNFNRFEYYEKTLVSDFQFSNSLRTNATKWLFVRINWIDFLTSFDMDPILQFLNILGKKLEGMSFQYNVILPEFTMAESAPVKRIVVDKLRIPMFLDWFKVGKWFYSPRVNRSLALTILRTRPRLLRLPPNKEINVKFNDHCQGLFNTRYQREQHICNTDFLREDNVRAILQSIDSYFVEEERRMKVISGNG